MDLTPIELEKIITADGWVRVRSKGSHRQYRHPGKPGTVTIPFHTKPKDLPPKTVSSIYKQAGLKKKGH